MCVLQGDRCPRSASAACPLQGCTPHPPARSLSWPGQPAQNPPSPCAAIAQNPWGAGPGRDLMWSRASSGLGGEAAGTRPPWSPTPADSANSSPRLSVESSHLNRNPFTFNLKLQSLWESGTFRVSVTSEAPKKLGAFRPRESWGHHSARFSLMCNFPGFLLEQVLWLLLPVSPHGGRQGCLQVRGQGPARALPPTSCVGGAKANYSEPQFPFLWEQSYACCQALVRIHGDAYESPAV